MKTPRATLFTFGYWGWGSGTPQLVAAIDAVEKARGRRPPRFVDIRYSRSVRADGFRDSAFADLVGNDRYRWMRELGNRRIAAGGGGIEINQPAAAAELLDLALDDARESRRVIFFCACELPGSCHRRTVAKLVIAAARRRRIAVDVMEWPGGEPIEMPGLLRTAAASNRKSLPLGGKRPAATLLGLPWGSRLWVEYPDGRRPVVSGPARFRGGAWELPVFEGDGEAAAHRLTLQS